MSDFTNYDVKSAMYFAFSYFVVVVVVVVVVFVCLAKTVYVTPISVQMKLLESVRELL